MREADGIKVYGEKAHVEPARQGKAKRDAWERLRGALRDVFAELGGGEKYVQAERKAFYSSQETKMSRFTGTLCFSPLITKTWWARSCRAFTSLLRLIRRSSELEPERQNRKPLLGNVKD